MTFPEFLESRPGNTLGYTLMGAVAGAVGYPIFMLIGIRYVSVDVLERMTSEVFLRSDIEATVLCAGLGLICGARFGPLISAVLGLVLGLVLMALAAPLGLYDFYFPEGIASWILALFAAIATVFSLVIGLARAQEDRIEHDLSLTQIRQKSRRR